MTRTLLAGLALVLLVTPALVRAGSRTPPVRKPAPAASKPAASKPAPRSAKVPPATPVAGEGEPGVSLEEARRSVEMLDGIYQLTLQEIHRRFPVGSGQPVVAALVIRDIQKRMNTRGGPQSRFLAVDLRAMNPDHAPKDAFEQEAAAKLAAGARRYEVIEASRLRMATVVPLGGTCFPCHSTPAGGVGRAAISWSVPLAH